MTTQVVLITGALTSIRRATALAFARDGANMMVSGRREDAGNTLVQKLRDAGADAAFLQADVRHEDDERALVDQTVARCGRLDVAVNNAGTAGKPRTVTEQTPESYAVAFDTNVPGTFAQHEARTAGDAGAEARQHHQPVLDDGAKGGGWCVDRHRQQARR